MSSRSIGRATLAALLTILAALALAGSVSAAPGNGAQHIDESACVPFPGEFVWCYEVHSLVNFTENKNNISGFIHEDQSQTFTWEPGSGHPGCTESFQIQQKSHILIKKESGVHEYRFKGQTSNAYVGCSFSPDERCTFTSNYHYANGQFQYDRPDVSCTPL